MPGGVQTGPAGGIKIGASGGDIVVSAAGQPCCCGGGTGDCPCHSPGDGVDYWIATVAIEPVAACDELSDPSCNLAPFPGGINHRDGGHVPGAGVQTVFQAPVFINAGPSGAGCVTTITPGGDEHTKCTLCATDGELLLQTAAGAADLIPFINLTTDTTCSAYYILKRFVAYVEWRVLPVEPGDPQFGTFASRVQVGLTPEWHGRRGFEPEFTNWNIGFGTDGTWSTNSAYTNWTPGDPGHPFPCCSTFVGVNRYSWFDSHGVVCEREATWSLVGVPCSGPHPPPGQDDNEGELTPESFSAGAFDVGSVSMVTRLWNAAKSLPGIAAAIAWGADDDTIARRLAVCDDCENNNAGVCGKLLVKTERTCGCMIALKVRGRHEVCPDGRWA